MRASRPSRARRGSPRGALAILSLLPFTLLAGAQAPQRLDVPPIDVGERQLAARRQAQLETRDQLDVFHDFSFTDRLEESGITFRHEGTEDGHKFFKMVHYDHGNGIAAADVDGDDRSDLYLTNQIGSNELWRNLGGGRFENVTAAAGVGLSDRISVTASFADIDNDGDPDLFVTTVRMGNVLFENDGTGRFRDITAAAGVGHVGHSSGAVFFDYDLDGLLDLFVTNVGRYTTDERGPGGYYIGLEDAFAGHLRPDRTEPSILYRNHGGNRFEDVTEKVGLVDDGWAGDASFADLDGDLYPDLYVLDMQGDDHYWENQGGQRFVEKTAAYFPKTPWGAMGIAFFDYDGDGLIDLLITDMHSDMSAEVFPEAERQKSIMMWDDDHLQGGDNNIFGNALYRNTSSPPFVEVSDQAGAENYWPWGPSVGDLNADGYEDVFIASSMSYPYRYGINSVLLNNAGDGFVHSEFILGVEPRRDGRTNKPWFEIDCSSPEGQSTQRLKQICAGRRGAYTVWGNLGTRTSVIFDLDDDGDLDIVTGEFHAEPQVLVSNLAERKDLHFLKVELVGTRSNRDGLGATVRLHSGQRVQVRYHNGKSGYLSQSALPIYFGLGESGAVDRIEVRWPSGVEQVIDQGIPRNTRFEIVEPSP
ncbi:MAG TPA: CRTAC1 family protein [Thermoanaerobaculia bacterium]|nr:CRTAC1 family protein [Thermoanaerobaculia bacterium]